MRNYLETDKVTKITIRRVNDGSQYRNVAVISTSFEGDKNLVLGIRLSPKYELIYQ